MFKLIQFLFLIFNPFLLSPAFSQSMDGLKEIVTIQQEKIARIENNVKNLILSVIDIIFKFINVSRLNQIYSLYL